MGSGGGGTTTSIQDVPREFKPAFTNLFNSAFGAARTAAGQPGFGTLGSPGQATQISDFITGFGGQGQPSPFAPPGSPFMSPFQDPGGFQNQAQLPGNVPSSFDQGQSNSQQLLQQGQQGQQGQFPGGKGAPQQQGNQLGFTGQAQAPPGTSDPFSRIDPNQTSRVGGSPGGKGVPEQGVGSQFPGSLQEGTTGITRSGRPSQKIPLASGPPIVGQPFGERFTAGTSPLEFESLMQREDLARQLQGVGDPLLGLGQFTAQGGFLDPRSNPFLGPNIEASLRPITQEFTNSVLPNFNSQAIQSGAFGGSSARDMAFNQLASGFGQQLLDTGTGIAFENFQRERQLQQNAGQLLDQGALLNQLSPELLAQVGLGQRELGQRSLDEALLQFQESINAPFRPLFPLASIIQGGDIGSAFSTTVPGPSALSSGIVGALGGASAGAGIGDLFGLEGAQLGGAGGLGALLGGLGGGLG